jgi:hypothetical protein
MILLAGYIGKELALYSLQSLGFTVFAVSECIQKTIGFNKMEWPEVKPHGIEFPVSPEMLKD